MVVCQAVEKENEASQGGERQHHEEQSANEATAVELLECFLERAHGNES